MSQPTPYVRQFDFAGYSSSHPGQPQPGVQLDAEFDAIRLTITQALANIERIQRDDTQLRNQSVKIATLADEVVAGLLSKGWNVEPWHVATSYDRGVFLTEDEKVFLVAEPHVSTSTAADSAANKIVRVFDTGTLGALDQNNGASMVRAASGETVEQELNHGGRFINEGAGAVVRTTQDRLRETISVRDFGADPTGVTDSHAAIMSAKAAAITLRRDLVFPKGTYSHADTLDLSGFELRIRAEGEVHLQCTDPDTPVCVRISGAGLGAAKQVFQDFNIWGANGASQIGLQTVNSQLSLFRNITVRNVGGIGVEIIGDVLSVYDSVQVVPRGRPVDIVPEQGFVLSGNVQITATAACTFINCMAEVASVRGWYLAAAINCKWVGGTSEGLGYPIDPEDPTTPAIGLLIDAASQRNNFDCFFLEYNVGGDVVVYGHHNRMMHCTTASLAAESPYESVRAIIVKAGAIGNVFEDGEAFAVEVEAGAAGTIFRRMMFGDRVYDAGDGTKIDDCRQLYYSSTRYPSRYAGNVENDDPKAWDFYLESNDDAAVFEGESVAGSLTQAANYCDWTRDGNRVKFSLRIEVSAQSAWPEGILRIDTDMPAVTKGGEFTFGYVSGLSLPAGCYQLIAMMPQNVNFIRLAALKSDGSAPAYLMGETHITGGLPLVVELSGQYRCA